MKADPSSDRSTDRSTDRLLALDACAVSDAMDKLGLAGTVSGLEQRSTTRRIAGPVVTCRLVAVADVANAPARPGAPRHLGTTAIESARPGDIIVVEQRSGVDAGCWGGILTLGAKLRGVAGVVADGPVRDIDEARGHDFPIYCRSLTARTARGRVAEVSTNEPVTVGSITVRAGDYLIADGSGVVFVPAQDVDRVLDAAEAIARREAAMAAALKEGKPISQVMGADYEHMLR